MRYVRRGDLARHRQGSLEARLATVRTAVAEALGAEAQVLATHEDYALVRGSDGYLQQVRYQLTEDGAQEVVIAEAADVPVLEGYGLDRAVADDLRTLTEALLAGENLGRDQWQDLARMTRGDVTYWVTEALDQLAEAQAHTAWMEYFSPQEPQIRKALHGHVREIEAPVPQLRFGRFAASKVEEYVGELRECLVQLQSVAGELFDGLGAAAVYNEEAMEAIHQSLRADAGDIAKALAQVEHMDWTGHLMDVAQAHDRLAGRLKDALIMQAHLKSATGVTHG